MRKIISPMFFNPAVPVEEEMRQAAAWKAAQRTSERRSRGLFHEWMQELNPCRPGDITPEMIERAREYPIENLVEANSQGMARCIFHEDDRPSMSIRKFNRARCFACGVKADVIDVYRQIHGASFQEAVRALCN